MPDNVTLIHTWAEILLQHICSTSTHFINDFHHNSNHLLLTQILSNKTLHIFKRLMRIDDQKMSYGEFNFHLIWLVGEKSLVKWAPRYISTSHQFALGFTWARLTVYNSGLLWILECVKHEVNKTIVLVIRIYMWIIAIPDSKVHGANMGPNWGRQDPVGPHVGLMDFVIWDAMVHFENICHISESYQNCWTVGLCAVGCFANWIYEIFGSEFDCVLGSG